VWPSHWQIDPAFGVEEVTADVEANRRHCASGPLSAPGKLDAVTTNNEEVTAEAEQDSKHADWHGLPDNTRLTSLQRTVPTRKEPLMKPTKNRTFCI